MDDDSRGAMSEVVKTFIEAIRHSLKLKLMHEGGTDHGHMKAAFLKTTADYSDKLNKHHLILCMSKHFSLDLTEDQANKV